MSIVVAYRSSRRWRLYTFAALILIVLACLGPLAAHADGPVVTAQEAQRAALAWLHTAPVFASTDQSGGWLPAGAMLEIKDQAHKETIAYVQELLPIGFIIVTPSYDLKPVIAYSNDSVFSTAEVPENVLLDMLRTDIPMRLKATEVNTINSGGETEAQRQWQAALEMVDEQGLVRGIDAESRIQWKVDKGPYVTSTWNQKNDPYGRATWNYYTPTSDAGPDEPGNADNYYCGCVATAFGQILNHNRWPITGTGSHSYVWVTRTLSVDFGSTTYDWENALDAYDNEDIGEANRWAAGRVTHDAGVAVDMQYGEGGSGAYTSDVADALRAHFRSAGEWVVNADSSFYDRLYANMMNERPGILSIQTATSGHAVVIDGVQYNSVRTKYYHLNMGWGGAADAYYNIVPPFTAGGYLWTVIPGAVLDIVPTPDLVELGTTCSDSSLGVSWDVSQRQTASEYELQQVKVPTTIGTFVDGAENGTGNWVVSGHWRQTSDPAKVGSYSFQGYVDAGDGSGYDLFSTFTLDKPIKIEVSTAMDYWWGSRYFDDTEARLEISTDGSTWVALKEHAEVNHGSVVWHPQPITTEDLTAYVGKVIFVRFVIDNSGSWWAGSSVGFFLDGFSVSDCYSGDWTTVGADISGTSKGVSIQENGEYLFRTRAHCCSPSAITCSPKWWEWSEVESITVSGLYKSADTGAWGTGSTWDAGTAPGASNSAIIQANHTVTVNDNQTCHDLTTNAGGIVDVAAGKTVAVTDDLVNNGELRQIRVVNGGADVGFFDTGGYGGVLLNAEGVDLGSTEVTIRGNQDCTTGPTGSSIRRCLSITPVSPPPSPTTTVTFYFSPDELDSGQVACEDVKLYHHSGGAWLEAGTVVERQCDGDLYYVKVKGVNGFSGFVADSGSPGGEPLAVGLARFEAWPVEDTPAVQLEWETGCEITTLGFNLYREALDGNRETGSVEGPMQLNEGLIQAEFSGNPLGAVYPWLDEAVTPGVTYGYWLETLNTQLEATAHAPVTVTVPVVEVSRWGVYLPVVTK